MKCGSDCCLAPCEHVYSYISWWEQVVFWWNEDINIVLNVSAFNKQVELPPLVHVENFFQGVLEIGNHI